MKLLSMLPQKYSPTYLRRVAIVANAFHALQYCVTGSPERGRVDELQHRDTRPPANLEQSHTWHHTDFYIFTNESSSDYDADDEGHALVAVSDEKIASALYRRIRTEHPHVQEPPDLDAASRGRICRQVFDSNYFQYAKDEYLFEDLDEMYNRLRHLEPNILPPAYKSSADPGKPGFLQSPFGTRLVRRVSTAVGLSAPEVLYTNPTKLMDVYASEEAQQPIPEYVFTCLRIVQRVDEETMYFAYISAGEYNLGDTSDSYVAGRFVFSYLSLLNDDLDVFAVAEEAAENVTVRSSPVELLYVRNRAEHPLDDRICALSRRERLRVCTLVLGSEYFESDPVFVPRYDHVDRSKCFKREISFQNHRVKKEVDVALYEEWTIRCRLQQTDGEDSSFSYPSEYFLSRAYNSSDAVFVFSSVDETKVLVENMFRKVRFLI